MISASALHLRLVRRIDRGRRLGEREGAARVKAGRRRRMTISSLTIVSGQGVGGGWAGEPSWIVPPEADSAAVEDAECRLDDIARGRAWSASPRS